MPTATAPAISITGYYRFTDIFFEWHVALPNQEDVSPLKATIAYDAIVHPDHPLRKEGNDGIELYIGTFENGEARLLFSSAQIEYIRYWLHAIGLTKSLIPIPSSEYLITQSSLLSCSPSIYKDPATLKRAIKLIERNNKRLKGTEPMLASRRLMFEKVRTYWGDKKGTWLAVDFEAWDRDHTALTEFGWSLLKWEKKEGSAVEGVEERGHLILQKHRVFTQTYVPDNRDRYSFGHSENVDKETFGHKVCALIEKHQKPGPLFLIFHDPSQDLKYLRLLKAPVSSLSVLLPDTTPEEGIFVIDTAEMLGALLGEGGGNKRSLTQATRLLGIPAEYFHNAGNDAHYTMLVMKSMASGDPVDAQRQARWPEHISSHRPAVEIQKPADADEDSDYSDTEAMLGIAPKLGDPYEELERDW